MAMYSWFFILKKMWFSIVMLIYQRVPCLKWTHFGMIPRSLLYLVMLQGRLVITWSHWSIMYTNYTYTTEINTYVLPPHDARVHISQYYSTIFGRSPTFIISTSHFFAIKKQLYKQTHPPTHLRRAVAQHPAHPLWIRVRPPPGRWCSRPSAAHPRHPPRGRRVWSPWGVGGTGKETNKQKTGDESEKEIDVSSWYMNVDSQWLSCMYHVCIYIYICMYVYVYVYVNIYLYYKYPREKIYIYIIL